MLLRVVEMGTEAQATSGGELSQSFPNRIPVGGDSGYEEVDAGGRPDDYEEEGDAPDDESAGHEQGLLRVRMSTIFILARRVLMPDESGACCGNRRKGSIRYRGAQCRTHGSFFGVRAELCRHAEFLLE